MRLPAGSPHGSTGREVNANALAISSRIDPGRRRPDASAQEPPAKAQDQAMQTRRSSNRRSVARSRSTSGEARPRTRQALTVGESGRAAVRAVELTKRLAPRSMQPQQLQRSEDRPRRRAQGAYYVQCPIRPTWVCRCRDTLEKRRRKSQGPFRTRDCPR